ncbi:MAG: hypothetical protein FWC64_05230 [Treponema sp.]|nr:hypothetical protein [Treponema sp.]
MKNPFKFFGIAVLVAAIGLSMAACDTGSTNAGNGLPPAGDGSITFAPGAPPMTFTGVVDQDGNPVNRTMDFTHFLIFREDDEVVADVSLVIPGSEIRLDGDTLNLRLGTPWEELLISASDWWFGGISGISATTGLRVISMDGEGSFHNADRYSLNWMIPPDPDAYDFTSVVFVYANIAGTIRGIGIYQDEYNGWSEVITLNMELRPGWNTVIGTMGPDPILSGRWNLTAVTGRPGEDFVWVLRRWGDD